MHGTEPWYNKLLLEQTHLFSQYFGMLLSHGFTLLEGTVQ